MNTSHQYKVLFVCLGNICRSPAAEAVFLQLVKARGCAHRFEVDSAGTYSGHRGELADPRMRRHASRRGIDITHRARPVTAFDLEHFDLVIGMDANNVSNLKRMAASPEDAAKVKPMAQWLNKFRTRYDYVPDPYYEGHEGFELVLDLLEDACEGLLDDLLNKLKHQK